jgi:chemotaxis signal transduction protein
MSTTALVKTGENSQHDELIQLVSFMLADEEYDVEVLKVRGIALPVNLNQQQGR